MKISIKKILKFATLLITSIIIASASADVVSHMYFGGTVDVISRKLVWIIDGTPQSTNIANLTLTVEAGGSITITNKVYLKNEDSNPHNLTITVTRAVSADKFDLFVDIYSNETGSWVLLDTLDATNSGDYFSTYELTPPNPLDGGKAYKLDFRVTATADANDATFELRVDYE
jgi:hypothetical protein